MASIHSVRFPGESEEYRRARDELLKAELDLRTRLEEVALLRRGLPLGGEVREDYLFEEGGADLEGDSTVRSARFSQLFEPGKDSLIVYSFMYGPEMPRPCPMCTSILDGLNGTAIHARQRVNFVVVAKSPLERIRAFARERGWLNLRLLSSARNTYNRDYHGETAERNQIPAINVFVRRRDFIHHLYNAEALYTSPEPGQDARHVDLIWPLWNLFDLTPEGRGADWYPRLSYER